MKSLVTSLLDTYNARDLEGFMAHFANDIVIYRNNEDRPFLVGIESVKNRYRELFEKSPNLKANIVDRRIEPPYVYDTEVVTGRYGDSKQHRFNLRYKIEGGKIVEVMATEVTDQQAEAGGVWGWFRSLFR